MTGDKTSVPKRKEKARRVEELCLRACVCAKLVIAAPLAAIHWAKCVIEEETPNIGDVDRALSMLSKAAFLAPENELIFTRRADVYIALGDVRAALDCTRHALRIKPNLSWIKQKVAALADCRGCVFAENGDLPRALAHFDEAIFLDARTPPYWMHRALLYLEQGAFSKTIADLGAYLEIEHSEPEAYILRGKLLWKLGMVDKATRDIGRAKALCPWHPEVEKFQSALASGASTENANAGKLMLNGDFEAAGRLLGKTIRVQPENVRMRVLAADCARSTGDLELATDHLGAALQFNNRERESRGAVAMNAKRELRDIWQRQALVLNDRAVTLLRENPSAQAAMKARVLFDKAIELWPQGAILYLHRGDCSRTIGDLTSALFDYERAQEQGMDLKQVQPRLAIVHYVTGQDMFNRRRIKEAKQCFTKSIQLAPKVAEYRANRGLANDYLGDTDGAYEDFTIAKKLDPHNEYARNWLAAFKPLQGSKSPHMLGTGLKTIKLGGSASPAENLPRI